MVVSADNPQTWFTQTRLHPPEIDEDFLARPALLARLDEAIVAHPLTLVSAPAGSGKTTLVSAWLQGSPPFPVSWLRLGAEDNDPAVFLAALLAAMQALDPNFGAEWRALLASTPDLGGAAQRWATMLVNELLALSLAPCALVLDDLHLITEPAVLSLLDVLLDNLPPDVHIVATSRYDPPLPLARLRLQGRLAEFRLDDLRFDDAEARMLLNDNLQLKLSAADLDQLYTQTEGWVAGLRLLALSLSGLASDAERASFLGQLDRAGDHLFDFLAEEVLDDQPPETRRFLLETAVLDELTPERCAAVTGRRDATRQLDDLLRRNLFLSRVVDDGKLVYRFHDLFAAFLRQRLPHALSREQIQVLHRRAATVAPTPDRAIRHFLDAALWAEAAEAIERTGRAELAQGFVRGQVGKWIAELPRPFGVDRPGMAYILGALAHQAGRMDEARGYLERAVAGFKAAGDKAALTGAMFRLAGAILELEGVEASLPLLNHILDRPLSITMRVATHIQMTWLQVSQYDWPQVDRHISRAINLTLASGEESAFRTLAQHMGIVIYFGDLGLAPFKQFCEQALARFGDGQGIIQMGAYLHLGTIAVLDGRLSEALQFASKTLEISHRLGGFAYVDQNAGFVQGVVAAAYNNREAVALALEEALRRADERGQYRAALAALAYYSGRNAWLDGERRRLCEMRVLMDSIDHRLQPLEAEAAISLLDAYVADLDGRYATGERLARHAIQLQRRFRHVANTGCAELTLAEMYLKWNRSSDALVTLEPALAKWARRGFPGAPLLQGPSLIPLLEMAVENGVQVEFAARVLNLFPGYAQPRAVPVRETGETLTARQVEVLRLIMTGASNRAIAEELVISPHTVKSHVTSILAKLNVSSRTEAAAVAWKLLP